MISVSQAYSAHAVLLGMLGLTRQCAAGAKRPSAPVPCSAFLPIQRSCALVPRWIGSRAAPPDPARRSDASRERAASVGAPPVAATLRFARDRRQALPVPALSARLASHV